MKWETCVFSYQIRCFYFANFMPFSPLTLYFMRLTIYGHMFSAFIIKGKATILIWTFWPEKKNTICFFPERSIFYFLKVFRENEEAKYLFCWWWIKQIIVSEWKNAISFFFWSEMFLLIDQSSAFLAFWWYH